LSVVLAGTLNASGQPEYKRHSGIQILTSDNGGENCSKVMQEVCEELNIKHIKTSFYHPQGNAKLERFHRTLHDILSKLTADNPKSWILNQALCPEGELDLYCTTQRRATFL
jgi:transposase InsO family protein